jgi:hypothetical protein
MEGEFLKGPSDAGLGSGESVEGSGGMGHGAWYGFPGVGTFLTEARWRIVFVGMLFSLAGEDGQGLDGILFPAGFFFGAERFRGCATQEACQSAVMTDDVCGKAPGTDQRVTVPFGFRWFCGLSSRNLSCPEGNLSIFTGKGGFARDPASKVDKGFYHPFRHFPGVGITFARNEGNPKGSETMIFEMLQGLLPSLRNPGRGEYSGSRWHGSGRGYGQS